MAAVVRGQWGQVEGQLGEGENVDRLVRQPPHQGMDLYYGRQQHKIMSLLAVKVCLFRNQGSVFGKQY